MEEPEIRTAAKPSINIQELKFKSVFNLNEIKNGNPSPGNEVNSNKDEGQYENAGELKEEDVLNAVRSYAEKKQEEGAKQLFVTLTTSTITFKDNVISLYLTNATQMEKIQNMKQELLDEIRKSLKDNRVSLEVSMTKTESVTKAYKPSDIFKTMIEKNPALNDLKKRFDLEIDY